MLHIWVYSIFHYFIQLKITLKVSSSCTSHQLIYSFSTISSGQNSLAAVFLKDIVEPAYNRARNIEMPQFLQLVLAKVFCEYNSAALFTFWVWWFLWLWKISSGKRLLLRMFIIMLQCAEWLVIVIVVPGRSTNISIAGIVCTQDRISIWPTIFSAVVPRKIVKFWLYYGHGIYICNWYVKKH